MDPKTLTSKLDRILALRGDPTSGVGAAAWTEALGEVDREQLLRAVIAAVRELLIPGWTDMHKNDQRPQRALAAAEAWLETKSADSITEAKAAAKACTEAKNETFGTDHRVPEAARATAWAATKPDNVTGLHEALGLVEHELLARIALTGEYHRGPEQRRAIVAILKKHLLPPEPAVEAAPTSLEPAGPVPYSPESHFELGQRLIHKKFGDVTVTSVGETWIEVQIPDGTKKRLAHKPQP